MRAILEFELPEEAEEHELACNALALRSVIKEIRRDLCRSISHSSGLETTDKLRKEILTRVLTRLEKIMEIHGVKL